MREIKILFLGDYNAHTGFGTVNYNIIQGVKKVFKRRGEKIKIDICAINYFGDMYEEDEDTFVFSALKSTPIGKQPDSRDDFGRLGFMHVLENSIIAGSHETEKPHNEYGYDGIFIVQDAPIITPMVPILRRILADFKRLNLKQFKSIFYFPVDNDLVEIFTKDLDFFDTLVTYNEYSRQAVLKFKPELKGRLKIMPHGLDLKQFYPLPDDERQAFRKEYFGEHADKFIVLNLNRNQPRKDIPCTIFGFEEYKQRNPNAFLYLHMNPADPLGWDLRLLLQQTTLQEDIDYMFPPRGQENHAADVELINKIYNSCDVGLTTTLGEGWGLFGSEAMGCRLPLICPLNTSFFEITNNGERAYVLENLYPYCGHNDNMLRRQSDYMEVADKLEEVYDCLNVNQRKPRLQKKLDAAFDYVQTLAWPGLAEKWAELIRKTF